MLSSAGSSWQNTRGARPLWRRSSAPHHERRGHLVLGGSHSDCPLPTLLMVGSVPQRPAP